MTVGNTASNTIAKINATIEMMIEIDKQQQKQRLAMTDEEESSDE
jgi:hypothetical protein